MKVKIPVIVIILLLDFVSCKPHKSYYEKCFTKWEKETGNRFYESLEKFENLLLEKKFLNRKDKKSYSELFRTISRKDSLIYQLYDSIKSSNLSDEFEIGRFLMINQCSFISYDEATNNKFRCNPDNIQRLSFYKLTYKDVDDDIIGNILIFSDYKNKYSRLNVAYLSYLYMKGIFDKTSLNIDK